MYQVGDLISDGLIKWTMLERVYIRPTLSSSDSICMKSYTLNITDDLSLFNAKNLQALALYNANFEYNGLTNVSVLETGLQNWNNIIFLELYEPQFDTINLFETFLNGI